MEAVKRVEATFAIVPVDVSLRSGRYQQNKISGTLGSNVKMNWVLYQFCIV